MTKEIKKTEIVEENSFGDGDYTIITRSPSGYYRGYGSVVNKDISTKGQYKYIKYVKRDFIKHLEDAQINLINESNRCGEIINEMNKGALEKKVKNLG